VLLRRTFLVPGAIVAAVAIVATILIVAADADRVVARAPVLRPHPNVIPFQGLGGWIDIYDKRSWKHPGRAVAALAEHGVRTLYLQTGNDARPHAIVRPPKVAAFLDAAHATGLRVIAWYLPGFVDITLDLQRVEDAIDFLTPAGERFDGFGLDIESAAVPDARLRTARLLQLSDQIRAFVGTSYPLGAITPSPHGMLAHPRYWPRFPYPELALRYDAFLPMTYFTWRDRKAIDAHDYVTDSLQILREGVGSTEVPVHVIGGIAQDASLYDVRGFTHAAESGGVIGESLYSAPGVTRQMWRLLGRIRPGS
jgi:hypothetical protein